VKSVLRGPIHRPVLGREQGGCVECSGSHCRVRTPVQNCVDYLDRI
jgi:hypothetical protein